MILKLNNLTKQYGNFTALNNFTYEFTAGVYGLLGPNGAGKSTLLHILACIDNYQKGEYTIDGTLVKNLSKRQYAKIRNEKNRNDNAGLCTR